jgi:hypothetical protein
VADLSASLIVYPANNMCRRKTAEALKDVHNSVRGERCRETGLWLVSADVTGERDGRISWGPTAVLNPAGEVAAQLPLEKPACCSSIFPAVFKYNNLIRISAYNNVYTRSRFCSSPKAQVLAQDREAWVGNRNPSGERGFEKIARGCLGNFMPFSLDKLAAMFPQKYQQSPETRRARRISPRLFGVQRYNNAE